MSVSCTGELATLLEAPGDSSDATTGTLARVPLVGGEPRRVLDDVLEADWLPDGRELALVRRVRGEFQLEYPIGNVVVRQSPASHLRVSPGGDRVAAIRDGQDVIVLYDRAGRKTAMHTALCPQPRLGRGRQPLVLGARGGSSSLWGRPNSRPRQVYRPMGPRFDKGRLAPRARPELFHRAGMARAHAAVAKGTPAAGRPGRVLQPTSRPRISGRTAARRAGSAAMRRAMSARSFWLLLGRRPGSRAAQRLRATRSGGGETERS